MHCLGSYIIGACVAVTVVSFNLLFSTTSTSYYTPIQIPNSNNNLLLPKPLAKLLIHVGPAKTGTTTLQAKLSNGKFRKELLDKDNVAVLTNYGYIQFREFLKGCFLQPTNDSYCEKEDKLWDIFFNLLKQTSVGWFASYYKQIIKASMY